MTKVPLSQLVLDYTIYPRNAVDAQNVRTLVDALESGIVLPPLIADRKSKRVTDGFHRVKAYERHSGPDTKVDVEFRDYASEADMVLDAVRLNAIHGKRLTPYDVAVVATRAQQFGLAREAIASALGLTRDRFTEIVRDRIAAETGSSEPVLLKRSVRHLAGTTLTESQTTVNQHLSGWSPRFHARQLISIIEAHMLPNPLDDETREDFARLHSLLGTFI